MTVAKVDPEALLNVRDYTDCPQGWGTHEIRGRDVLPLDFCVARDLEFAILIARAADKQ